MVSISVVAITLYMFGKGMVSARNLESEASGDKSVVSKGTCPPTGGVLSDLAFFFC